jgi:DNA-binding transcriptional LysR family regulator
VNTRQLRHFLAVLDLGSLSAAAEAVHLSQPALSRSLRALEDELRIPLFDRIGRRLRPTPYAIAYAGHARRIVFDAKEGSRELDLMRGGEIGPLSFGMGSSLAAWLLGPMLLKLMHDAPGLKLSALIKTSDMLIEALVEERLDFFVGDVRVATLVPDMAIEPLYRCTFGWFARQDHPLAKLRRIGIADLEKYPLIATGYLEESLMRRFAQLYSLKAPMFDHFAVMTDDVTTLRKVIAKSDAVVPATDLAMIDSLRASEVTAIDVVPPMDDLDMTLGIVWRQGRTLVPAADRAFEVVRAHFAEAAKESALLMSARRSAMRRAKGWSDPRSSGRRKAH